MSKNGGGGVNELKLIFGLKFSNMVLLVPNLSAVHLLWINKVLGAKFEQKLATFPKTCSYI